MDGFSIPIGADFSVMQEAVGRIIAAMDQMGNRIVAALEKTSAATMKAGGSMGQLEGGSRTAGAAAEQAGLKADGAGKKIMTMARGAIALGSAVSGVSQALGSVASIMTALSGNNFGTMLTNVTRIGRGLRNAMSSVWTVLSKLGTSNSFWKIAAGAAAGVAGVLVLRQAFRTVMGTVNLMRTSVMGVFRGMVAAARTAARGVASAFKGISSLPGKALSLPGLPIAGLLSLAGVVGGVYKSIGKAAEMETLEAGFAPLLNGAKAATTRIAELARFAADTPFELPEVASASRILQTLTKGVLATGSGLRMVGDVVSGVNGNFDEISVTIGRLYDGLQSGRPVGEPLMRLQELGVVSGDVRSQIEKLQKEGAAGPAVWSVAAAALAKFGGSMERQSVTWTGKLSNLSDTIGMVMAKFGEPIMDALKPYLDIVIKKVESLRETGIAAGNAIRMALDGALAAWQTGSFSALLMHGLELAFITGINTFMDGLRNGVSFLAGALVGILGSIKDGLMQSGLLGVFNSVAAAMGATLSASILNTMGKITGLKNWDYDAGMERRQAAFSMGLAKSGLEQLDFNGGFNTFAQGLERTWASIQTKTSKSKPFIDDSDAAQSYVETMAGIRVQSEKNREAAEKLSAAMDKKLQNGKPEDGASLGSAVSNKITPAVMSLTRIGGGGFANTVMSGQLGELRKQTGYLQKIYENTRYKGKVATAVYT